MTSWEVKQLKKELKAKKCEPTESAFAYDRKKRKPTKKKEAAKPKPPPPPATSGQNVVYGKLLWKQLNAASAAWASLPKTQWSSQVYVVSTYKGVPIEIDGFRTDHIPVLYDTNGLRRPTRILS